LFRNQLLAGKVLSVLLDTDSVQSKLEQNSLSAKGGRPSITVSEYCRRRLQSIFELTNSKVVYTICHQNEND
jgi:hypothetical protein